MMKYINMFRTFSLLLIVFFSVNLISPANTFAQNPKKTEKKTTVKSNIKDVVLAVEGMTCQKGCADGIDKKLAKTPGIKKSKTLQKTGKSQITYDASVISVKEIIRIIDARGYKATLAHS